jgi:arsenate reductase
MNLLYVCTHNRCRSILSEALTNHLAGGLLTAYSAGSQPVGEVHPLSVKYLQERGLNTAGLASKSWSDQSIPKPDLVFTVCDSAANESCPLWLGDCPIFHWGLPDPSKLDGTEAQVRDAFFSVMDDIEKRVMQLLAAEVHTMPADQLTTTVNELIGQ